MKFVVLAAVVALAVPTVTFAESPQFDPNQPVIISPEQFQPIRPVVPPTVPADRVTTWPQPTFTCPQAVSQLQSIVGQPESVAHQVTYQPPLIREPGYFYPTLYIAERLNIQISEQRLITSVWCG